MRETPTILQVLPRLESGGVERGTVEITEAIRRAGMRPLVASAGGHMIPHITHAGGEHITLPLDRKSPFTIYRNALALLDLVRARDIHLIHARSRAPAWAAYYAAKWAGIPFLTTFHGIYGTETNLKKRYNRVMVKGARVIAVSNFVREHVITTYGVDPTIIRTIPRGVDFNIFSETKLTPDRLQQVSKSWDLYDNFAPVIFCPGRISRIKGQHVLIEALAQIHHTTPLYCVIAGTDAGHSDYRAELDQLVRTRGLEGKVRIVPPTNYMAEAYTLANVVVVPSIQAESFGRVAIEAQAMGRLVIATDHGGARETVIPNETGYLVPPGNSEMLAEAIRYGLGRDERVTYAMGQFAMRHIAEHFSSERMKTETIAVYKELLG